MLARRDDQPVERRLRRSDAETGIEGRVGRLGRPGHERHATRRNAGEARDLGSGVLDDFSRGASFGMDG